MKCPHCQTDLPPEARFCFHCGAPQQTARRHPDEPPRLDLRADVEQQVVDQFFGALRRRLEEEHDPHDYQAYAERLYESGFRDMVQRRAGQLAARLDREDNPPAYLINRLLHETNEELLDYFLILHCRDLNAIPLPEAILSYQQADWESVDLYQMVLNYLELEEEEETVYVDFLKMPMDKLRNAGRSFLFPEKQERILLICDQTLFGSGKEGFALTEKGIYWKAHLEKARLVYYEQLDTIERKEDWITINGHFFNVNPSLNLKMLKLLKRIGMMVGVREG